MCTTGFTTASSPLRSIRPLPNARTAAATPPLDASSTRGNHCTAVMHASTNVAPREAIPISEPPLGIFLPKKRISRNDTTGMTGMIHA